MPALSVGRSQCATLRNSPRKDRTASRCLAAGDAAQVPVRPEVEIEGPAVLVEQAAVDRFVFALLMPA